jgi:hypothetical protein
MSSYTPEKGEAVGLAFRAVNPESIDTVVAAKVEDAEQHLSSPSYSRLRRLNKTVLQVLCVRRNLESDGYKEDLVERLMEWVVFFSTNKLTFLTGCRVPSTST